MLPAAQVQSLTVQGAAATITLAPLAGTGTRALRLTDADGVDYWLEYRTATGRDAWLGTGDDLRALGAGVLLRQGRPPAGHLGAARRDTGRRDRLGRRLPGRPADRHGRARVGR